VPTEEAHQASMIYFRLLCGLNRKQG